MQPLERVGGVDAGADANARRFRDSAVRMAMAQLPEDLFLGSIIQTAIADRPIYFAMTTQAYEELSLRPYLIRQGVAFKLNNGPVVADSIRGILPTPPSQIGSFTGPWIDLPRTEALVTDVFQHRGGFQPQEA